MTKHRNKAIPWEAPFDTVFAEVFGITDDGRFVYCGFDDELRRDALTLLGRVPDPNPKTRYVAEAER